jgi:hypothetical protein
MPNRNKIWEQMVCDVKMVIDAVDAGLMWTRVEPPDSDSTALEANGPLHTAGPKFRILCVRWKKGEQSRYAGMATVLEPGITIINLPPDTAKMVYERAAISLN